jgi:hypothetical protein
MQKHIGFADDEVAEETVYLEEETVAAAFGFAAGTANIFQIDK